LEPQFHALMIQKLGLAAEDFKAGVGIGNPSGYAERVEKIWPPLKTKLAAAVSRFTRAELEAMFDGLDACVTPVLGLNEAAAHPHMVARNAFLDVGGVMQGAPAPRFSRSTPARPTAPRKPGADAQELLAEAGYSTADIARIRAQGVLG
jgi:alpha-methylacyl-CoA racemase